MKRNIICRLCIFWGLSAGLVSAQEIAIPDLPPGVTLLGIFQAEEPDQLYGVVRGEKNTNDLGGVNTEFERIEIRKGPKNRWWRQSTGVWLLAVEYAENTFDETYGNGITCPLDTAYNGIWGVSTGGAPLWKWEVTVFRRALFIDNITALELNPTITPEELKKVELAYAETVRYIQRQGKQLYVNSLPERNAFIRKYQGNPAVSRVRAAKDKILEWYDIRTTSQEDIVALARKETNDFFKVRMIHDWVADVFAYDFDLLWWMDNVSGKNAIFTLGELIKRERGVCFEYAVLFWFLMDSSGIETYLICDYSEPGKAHAYNMVVIGGTGYIIDTTWDSGNMYQSGKIVQFRRMITKEYFMPDAAQSYKLRGW
jgi:transglutaminase-like putative cysteine protease